MKLSERMIGKFSVEQDKRKREDDLKDDLGTTNPQGIRPHDRGRTEHCKGKIIDL